MPLWYFCSLCCSQLHAFARLGLSSPALALPAARLVGWTLAGVSTLCFLALTQSVRSVKVKGQQKKKTGVKRYELSFPLLVRLSPVFPRSLARQPALVAVCRLLFPPRLAQSVSSVLAGIRRAHGGESPPANRPSPRAQFPTLGFLRLACTPQPGPAAFSALLLRSNVLACGHDACEEDEKEREPQTSIQ